MRWVDVVLQRFEQVDSVTLHFEGPVQRPRSLTMKTNMVRQGPELGRVHHAARGRKSARAMCHTHVSCCVVAGVCVQVLTDVQVSTTARFPWAESQAYQVVIAQTAYCGYIFTSVGDVPETAFYQAGLLVGFTCSLHRPTTTSKVTAHVESSPLGSGSEVGFNF